MPEAVARIASDSLFEPIVRYVFPNEDYKGFVDDFRRIASVDDFQAKVMDKAIGNIVRATSADLRRIAAALDWNRKKAARLMKQMGLKAKIRAKKAYRVLNTTSPEVEPS